MSISTIREKTFEIKQQKRSMIETNDIKIHKTKKLIENL